MNNNRAVLYARVSGDDTKNEGRNLDGQIQMCREYAERHGWSVVAELAEDDRGASGAELDLPRLNEMLGMARRGEFDILVVREIDRLSRSLPKQLFIEDELKKHAVRVEYVVGEYADTPEGNFMKNVRAAVAELERLKISERAMRGRVQAAKSGSVQVAGHPPYGYDLVKEKGKFRLQINEEEAQIVRLIFRWYTEGDEDGEWL
jgi:site-specific DNA recombinase